MEILNRDEVKDSASKSDTSSNSLSEYRMPFEPISRVDSNPNPSDLGRGKPLDAEKVLAFVGERNSQQNPKLEDHQVALDNVNRRVSRLIPEKERIAISDLAQGFLSGDHQRLAKVVAAHAGNPERLAKLVAEVNSVFGEKNSPSRMVVGRDGKLLCFSEVHDRAIQMDPKTGESIVVRVQHQNDGGVSVRPGKSDGSGVSSVFGSLSADAVQTVAHSGRGFGGGGGGGRGFGGGGGGGGNYEGGGGGGSGSGSGCESYDMKETVKKPKNDGGPKDFHPPYFIQLLKGR